MRHHSPTETFASSLRALAEASLSHPTLCDAEYIAWAVEESLDQDEIGRDFLVSRAPGDLWWISLGYGPVVAEVTFSIDPATADAIAILSPMLEDNGRWSPADVILVGSPESVGMVPSPAHGAVVPAVSVHHLGNLIRQAIEPSRPDWDVIHDPDWALHRNPVRSLLHNDR
jgi:hypothetical protein